MKYIKSIMKWACFITVFLLIGYGIFNCIYNKGEISGRCQTTCYEMTDRAITYTWDNYDDCLKECKNLRDFRGNFISFDKLDKFESNWGVKECR